MALGKQENLTGSGIDRHGEQTVTAVDHGQLVQDAMKGPWQSVYTDALQLNDGGCVDSAGC